MFDHRGESSIPHTPASVRYGEGAGAAPALIRFTTKWIVSECAVNRNRLACKACKARDAPLSSAWLRRWRGAACARSGAIQQQLALAGVARERCRALELCAGFVEAAELFQEVAAHARQEVVAPE